MCLSEGKQGSVQVFTGFAQTTQASHFLMTDLQRRKVTHWYTSFYTHCFSLKVNILSCQCAPGGQTFFSVLSEPTGSWAGVAVQQMFLQWVKVTKGNPDTKWKTTGPIARLPIKIKEAEKKEKGKDVLWLLNRLLTFAGVHSLHSD